MSRKYLNGRWCVRCNKTDPTPYLRENLKHFPPTGRVLDIGCGNGRNSKFMESLGYQVDSIDMAGDFGIKMTLGVDRLPRKRKYDIILANYILMFLDTTEQCIIMTDITYTAKKGAILIIEMYPAKDAYEYNMDDITTFFTEQGWEKIRKSKDRCVLRRVN